jgi:hypothetical protein
MKFTGDFKKSITKTKKTRKKTPNTSLCPESPLIPSQRAARYTPKRLDIESTSEPETESSQVSCWGLATGTQLPTKSLKSK